jgi:flagellar motor protein MotB
MTGSLEMLGGELTLAEAAEAARSGDFDGAVRLLEQSGGSAGGGGLARGGRGGPEGDIATASVPRDAEAAPDSGGNPWPGGGEPARLDLLARVYAQAGNLDAADAAWARVLELVPDEPSAVAGRRRVARVRSGWGRRRRLPWRALAAGAAVIVVAGGVVVLTVPFGSAPAVVSGSAAGAGPAASSLQAELDRLNAAKSRDAAAAAARQERLAALATALAAPGVHTSPGETDVSVSFDAGLFGPNATTPSTEGRRALQQWAEVLKGQSVRVTVLGHGVTVAGGPAAGGSTVALARAASAARVLATASGLPLTAFAIGSADQSTSAHPDGDPGANRTVTLLVAPA